MNDFYILNIVTGGLTEGAFNDSHHPAFTNRDCVPPERLLQIQQELIARWNRQQPGRWHYWLKSD